MGIKGFKWRKRTKEVHDLENVKIEKHEIYYSKYIASWYIAGGRFDNLYDILDFKDWLRSLNLTEKEVMTISTIAACGEADLTHSARAYLNDEIEEEL